MAKPVILTVDDDPDVLQSIERDLRSRYSERYRIMRAASAIEALDVLHRLKTRSDAVALLLADQRMPELDGVGFLSQATELFPNAKRALLTAYADTNAAIEAINSARVHYFLLKPWDPPDQNLYPPLDDMLNEFMDSYHRRTKASSSSALAGLPRPTNSACSSRKPSSLPVGGRRAIQHHRFLSRPAQIRRHHRNFAADDFPRRYKNSAKPTTADIAKKNRPAHPHRR